ncbi:transmembrane protein 232 isoform X2 [Zootoca vivipara]|uniref:transmembrane protein 232 isoform X2 n=1 Tax=Zootoca vivipara TaxID=8524 RepID=UPI00293BC548|nr:transmembrane protein 232 isoform X2 [Zootoca vivipara]
MPIIKVPVVHKFGIVCHDEHKKIQQRLLTKYLKETLPPAKKKKHVNPFQLTEQFVEDFNFSLQTESKEKFIELAKKMVARCKRRSGLSTLGVGKYVDLPGAWAEAVLLSQCKGEIHEEAVEILLISLDHAPLVPDHIPVLFFVAESVLYRLCYEAVEKPSLFACEITLSKGFSEEHRSRLHVGLKALAASEVSYQPYPNILFMVHFMLKAGEVICETTILSQTSLASDASLQEMPAKSFSDTLPMGTGGAVELNPEQKQFRIKPFLWHSLLVWVCVHNSCSNIDEVLKHVLFYKEELLQEDWLESVLGLMVLGEAAKLNMSCLRVLMDLVRDFISSSLALQKQKNIYKGNFSCWLWPVGYIYTNLLKEICLHGINADLQKTAFLGFCDCVKEHKGDKGLRGAGLLDLLSFRSSPDDRHDPFWIIRYGVVYNLVVLRSELAGDVTREGLRNAVWRSLQKQKAIEKDSHVLDALRIAEVECKGPKDPFIASKEKGSSNPSEAPSAQNIGWRVATSMCHHFLPPIGPDIPLPRRPVQKPPLILRRESELSVKEKKAKRLTLREELLLAGVPKYPYPDYLTRAEIALRTIIETQWERELEMRLKLEEKLLALELKEKQKLEEERFNKIMKWRLEKLNKTTKPYELPHKQREEEEEEEEEDEELTESYSSTQLSSAQLS